MSTVRVLLYKSNRTLKGEYPVCLCLTKNRQRKHIHLKLYGTPKRWNAEAGRFTKDKRVNPNHIRENAFLTDQEAKAHRVIGDFEREGKDWSLNQFEDAFLNKTQQGKIEAYFAKYIAKLRGTGHIGNAIAYERTFHMLGIYDPKLAKRTFNEIDIRYINCFDDYLQRRGCSGNTRKFYHKTLRSLINNAIKEGDASENSYPYGRNGFQVARLSEETVKRYLPDYYITTIKQKVSLTPVNEYARRLFLFSYYCGGMSFVDMAKLKVSSIVRLDKANYIVYTRQKTANNKNAKVMKIAVRAEIEELLDWFATTCQAVEDYLLPIVTIAGYEGEKLYMHIRNRRVKYGIYLKQLAAEFGFEGFNLTSYVSRHTMAMTLQREGVPREKISQIMGHNDFETTNTYLDSFENEVIDKAMSVL